jgi:hypothetical protein
MSKQKTSLINTLAPIMLILFVLVALGLVIAYVVL